MVKEDRYGIGEKLTTFADATRVVTDNIERSRFFNEDRLKKRANAKQVQVNDHVAIKAMTRSALEPQYDFGWRVVRVEGNVITCVDPRTGKTRKVNRALIQIVPSEAHFDEENAVRKPLLARCLLDYLLAFRDIYIIRHKT